MGLQTGTMRKMTVALLAVLALFLLNISMRFAKSGSPE